MCVCVSVCVCVYVATAAGPLNTPTKAEMRQQGADMWAPEQAHLQAQLAQVCCTHTHTRTYMPRLRRARGMHTYRCRDHPPMQRQATGDCMCVHVYLYVIPCTVYMTALHRSPATCIDCVSYVLPSCIASYCTVPVLYCTCTVLYCTCTAQIASHDPKAASQSFTVLYKLLKNILDNPNQTKYR